MPIAIQLYAKGPADPIFVAGDVRKNDQFSRVEVFPKRLASRSPEFVPDAAADAFVEGAENAKDGRLSSAAIMFRRAIDVGTKQFAPEIDVHNLGKRIDKLAADGRITQDLRDWAHKIRLETNEATHDLPKPTKQQVAELEQFTELVLTYLFTLPAKVKASMKPPKAKG